MIRDYSWKSLGDVRSDYGEGIVFKSFDANDVDLEVHRNEVVAVVSSDKIDASGEIVVPQGMAFDRFRRQPAVYFEHNMDALPLGPAQWIKSRSKDIIAKYKIIEDASDHHKAIATLVREGVYRSHSIGFLPHSPSKPTPIELRSHPEWAGANTIHRKGTLLEFSLVGVPCNDDAVAMAIGKSMPREVIDKLTGKTAATEQATEAVIKAVECSNLVSASDRRQKMLKEIEMRIGKIDVDKVISNALKSLRLS